MMRAAMRQARYQRYYNRGSRANWERMQAEEADEVLCCLGVVIGVPFLVIGIPLIGFVFLACLMSGGVPFLVSVWFAAWCIAYARNK